MASIKCGNCGQHHPSVQDVRNCYSGLDHNIPVVPSEDRRVTPRQAEFLARLRTERGLLTDGIGKLTREEASEEIGAHLSPKGKQARLDYEQKTKPRTGYDDPWQSEAPRNFRVQPDKTVDMTHEDWIAKVRADRAALRQDATQAQARVYGKSADPTGASVGSMPRSPVWPRFEDIPDGHYAFPSLTGNNDLDFVKVTRPDDGPFNSRYFVKRVIGGKPDMSIRGRQVLKIMEAIRAEGPDKAALRYGQEIGRCYKCNRSLTDETSRAMGIGPDCRSRL